MTENEVVIGPPMDDIYLLEGPDGCTYVAESSDGHFWTISPYRPGQVGTQTYSEWWENWGKKNGCQNWWGGWSVVLPMEEITKVFKPVAYKQDVSGWFW